MTQYVHAIEVRDLHKTYGDFPAVRGLSFDVAHGEVLAVLGPNGAGKTSTMEMLAGFRDRTSGHASVLGVDPQSAPPSWRDRIGIVLQSCGFDPYLNVREQLQLHAGYYSRPRNVDEVLELVGLTDFAKRKAPTLSGGQQRRLDVALALIGNPELLFLDEPTTGFDPGARRQMWDVVKGLCGQGMTVLLTTHYMDEAQFLADRVIVVARGQIVAEGPPESVGHNDAATRVSFRHHPSLDGADFPPGTEIHGDTIVIPTSEPTRFLAQLCQWATSLGIELDHLEVHRPSLEERYLALVGEAPQ